MYCLNRPVSGNFGVRRSTRSHGDSRTKMADQQYVIIGNRPEPSLCNTLVICFINKNTKPVSDNNLPIEHARHVVMQKAHLKCKIYRLYAGRLTVSILAAYCKCSRVKLLLDLTLNWCQMIGLKIDPLSLVLAIVKPFREAYWVAREWHTDLMIVCLFRPTCLSCMARGPQPLEVTTQHYIIAFFFTNPLVFTTTTVRQNVDSV